MMVCGDHRLGMYANQTIIPGEELTFNYRHDFNGPLPQWAAKHKLRKKNLSTKEESVTLERESKKCVFILRKIIFE